MTMASLSPDFIAIVASVMCAWYSHALSLAAVADHEVLVERDRLGIVTGVQVVLAQVVHHLERLVVRPRRVAAEVLEEVVGVASGLPASA